MARVLVSDPITPAGIDLLKQAGFEVEVKTDHTKEELLAKIKDFDALIVRSQTKVTADIIEAASNLKVIGRAGVGVDNVDIEAANKKGIIVMNAPDGNTISTAELSVAMLFGFSAQTFLKPYLFKSGALDRRHLPESKSTGKTWVLSVGPDRNRSRKANAAMGIKVIAFDPFFTEDNGL